MACPHQVWQLVVCCAALHMSFGGHENHHGRANNKWLTLFLMGMLSKSMWKRDEKKKWWKENRCSIRALVFSVISTPNKGFEWDGTVQLFGTKGQKFQSLSRDKGTSSKSCHGTGQDSLSKSGTGHGTGQSLFLCQNRGRDKDGTGQSLFFFYDFLF